MGGIRCWHQLVFHWQDERDGQSMCSWLPFSSGMKDLSKEVILSFLSEPGEDTFWDLLWSHGPPASWVALKMVWELSMLLMIAWWLLIKVRGLAPHRENTACLGQSVWERGRGCEPRPKDESKEARGWRPSRILSCLPL